MNVAIIGATGYGGAELIRILHQHPEVSIHSFHTSSQEGLSISQSYPHLQTVVEKDLELIDPEEIRSEERRVGKESIWMKARDQRANKEIGRAAVKGKDRVREAEQTR